MLGEDGGEKWFRFQILEGWKRQGKKRVWEEMGGGTRGERERGGEGEN